MTAAWKTKCERGTRKNARFEFVMIKYVMTVNECTLHAFFRCIFFVSMLRSYLWWCGESWRMDTCAKNGQDVGLVPPAIPSSYSTCQYLCALDFQFYSMRYEQPLFTCVFRLQRHFLRCFLIRPFGDDKLMRHLFHFFFAKRNSKQYCIFCRVCRLSFLPLPEKMYQKNY